MVKKTVILLLFLLPIISKSQNSYVNVSFKEIYNFLDEMADEKIIMLNSAIKPYTKEYIYLKLSEIDKKKDLLNARLRSELELYYEYYKIQSTKYFLPESQSDIFKNENLSFSLKHFSIFYTDSALNFSLKPVFGAETYINSSGQYFHTYRGAEASAKVGKHLSFYADLTDNTVSDILVNPTYLVNNSGGNYKIDESGNGHADFSEMNGGIILSWPYLDIGIIKDHLEWGDNYNGAIILSGHSPSFPMIKFDLHPTPWFSLNYIHAWLISEVIDSSLSYSLSNGHVRNAYKNKYMAANMYSVSPIKGINFSFGNSIIYGDMDINPAYLIPFFFYKSVDHTINHNIENQNSQMFLNFSSHLIKHNHLFFSLFFDEFSVKRIFDPKTHNFYSYKIGSSIKNWPFQNISCSIEYFRSVPITYKHYVPGLTFESNGYNLGSYLRDNSQEIFISINAKPLPRLSAGYSFSNSKHGDDFKYYDGKIDVTYPILQNIAWSNITHTISCSYQFLTNCRIVAQYMFSQINNYESKVNINYTPEYFEGMKRTFLIKANFGF